MGASDDDPGIIDAARQGDRVAWEQLYRGIYPRLRSFFVRRLGYEHAEDAVNETMARAIAAIGRYTPGASGFDGWVFGIARHVSADHYRRAARERRQPAVAHLVDGQGPQGPSMVDERLESEEEHERLRAMFARLGPSEQEILELRVIAGLSADEVASVLHRTPGAVRTSQSRALAHLRRLMESAHVGS